MDEPERRVLHRFKHGEYVQQYRGEFGFIFITLSRTKNGKKRAKFVCDVDGKNWLALLVFDTFCVFTCI